MSVKPMAGFDMENRDPNNLNEHLQVRRERERAARERRERERKRERRERRGRGRRTRRDFRYEGGKGGVDPTGLLEVAN